MADRSLVVALILVSVGLNASAQIFLKVGARSGFDVPGGAAVQALLGIVLRPAILAGLFCYGLSVLSWIYVLSRAEVSFAYPFLSLGFVVVAVASYLYLDEALTLQRMAAIALIALGTVLLARS